MTIEPTRFQANLLDIDLLTAELSGDPSAQIAAHLLIASKDSSDATKDARRAEEEQLRASEDRQVEEMHDQADAIRSAGWVRGCANIASGGLKIAGASYSLSGPEADAGATLQQWNGYGEVASGSGNVIGGYFDGEAKDAEAASVAAGHRAGESKRRLDDLAQAEREARELGRTALDVQRQNVQAKADSDQATIYLRA